MEREFPKTGWPRPPSCIPAQRLQEPPNNARVAVAGLVLVRQRPGTAKGVVFVTLEDETGVANVIVWERVFQKFRKAVMGGRMLRVFGRVQRDGAVTHVIADKIEDISYLLDQLADSSERKSNAVGRGSDPAN
ncbi:MAG: OB-fold nucleic acid binding domain-containing protein [Albidovulum sp.]|nr:OB-fold nucleic acid binding domain-containing protein [Albidovulum sp.]